jgi:hypothetical protein
LSNSRLQRYFDARGNDRQMGVAPARSAAGLGDVAGGRKVLELAVGTGLNLSLYPARVEDMLIIDLSEAMQEHTHAGYAPFASPSASIWGRATCSSLTSPTRP